MKTNGMDWDKPSSIFTSTFYYRNKIEIKKGGNENENRIHRKSKTDHFEWKHVDITQNT